MRHFSFVTFVFKYFSVKSSVKSMYKKLFKEAS